MTIATLAFLTLAGFVASLVDSMVGGGGIISLPALLAVGVPPYLALGTNKLAGTTSAAVASFSFVRTGHVDKSLLKRTALFTLGGSLLGSMTVLRVNPQFIQTLVLVVMLVMVIYTLMKKSFGENSTYRALTAKTTIGAAVLALTIGFYDGFVGPGTGSFYIFFFVTLFGFDFLTAAGNGRFLNFVSNAAALGVFLWNKEVSFFAGIPMAVAMFAGAYVGSRIAIRRGTALVKPLFVIITLALGAKIAFSLLR